MLCMYVCNRVKCSDSLTWSRLSLLCSHGLQVNSFCLVLHVDMLITIGILLATWILQKQPLTSHYIPKEIRKNCIKWLFSKDLQEACDWTHINYSQQTKKRKLHNLPLLSPKCLWSSVTLSRPCFPFALTERKSEFCTFLWCFFRTPVYHLLAFMAFQMSLSSPQHRVTWLSGCHVVSSTSLYLVMCTCITSKIYMSNFMWHNNR